MSFRKPRLQSSWCIILLAALLTLSSMGCGDADGEGASSDYFYVYVVHGYAGGGELSVYGSAGPLATGLTYGDIGGDPESVAGAVQPLKVDRTRFDGEVQILLSGASEVATISLDSFAFYPGETVTLFLTRRSGPNTYDLRVMRHNQLAQIPDKGRIDEDAGNDCVISISNGFSTSNVYTSNNFDIQLQWQPAGPPLDALDGRLIYDQARDQAVESVCGTLTPADFDLAPPSVKASIEGAIQARQMLLLQTVDNPWFYYVRGDSGFLEFRFAQWSGPDGGGSTVVGIRSSREYQQCISAAIQVPVLPDSDGAVSCDRSKFNELQVDDVKLRECNRFINYPGIAISPDNSAGVNFFLNSNAANECSFKFRPRTRNVDLVFDEGGAMDTLAVFQANYAADSWQHYTFFGDPINPFAYSLNSATSLKAGTLAELAVPLAKPANNGRTPAAP